MADIKRLGSVQRDVLAWMNSSPAFSEWYPGCGWVWGNQSESARICETLLSRGLVEKFGTAKGYGGRVVDGYRITQAGRDAVG